jgi:hypothetical protein
MKARIQWDYESPPNKNRIYITIKCMEVADR